MNCSHGLTTGFRNFFRCATRLTLVIAATALLASCLPRATALLKPEDLRATPFNEARVLESYPTAISPPRTAASQIELYYFLFHLLNAPNVWKNWEYHFQIAPASAPEWSYERIAKIAYLQRTRDDSTALTQLKQLAAAQGGNAIIDLYRRAILISSNLPAVEAYEYEGIVVRRTNK